MPAPAQPSVAAPLATKDAVLPIRDASRRIVRELGFMKPTLAGTELPASAVHALIEIGNRGGLTATDLCDRLNLEKSSVSRMLRKLVDGGELAEVSSDTDGRSKRLTLTAQGRRTLAAIDAFAHEQVGGALACLPAGDHAMVVEGLRLYAEALQARRAAPGSESKVAALPAVRIERGYRPGLIGRAVEMHAQFYARAHGFGAVFESRVAAGLAEFLPRLDRPCNAVWTALDGDRIVGTIAIDGEDLSGDAPAPRIAHLRWFIVEDGRRGGGLGRRLLDEALAFADRAGFAETRLWTFRGLDAARRLYEAAGFVLAAESPGCQWGTEVTEQSFVRPLVQPRRS
ncbi:GNAT family N-acetyltransferase [Azospirillum melinis]|uniref:GNAT family N-acetyltransferase n=1 Tax=Azospirillum melinis TaxID=328839 RepID=A0ABX2KLT0_9PROT|nr:GNAT family N-acetyltransferase [Azospirillum melinis]MBP2309978.1 DNA-binding MarR family transcriptional regulator/GNAT superfamily N-acetyltransferase [Azospirillum melinis]NUB02753.1 GNAT family N-acetyltransferase [Azospirillum melinis]